MSQSEWTFLSNGLDASNVRRSVTAGVTPPSGGGSFAFGFHSLSNTVGAVGKVVNATNFYPLANGATVRGAIQRNGNMGATMMLAALLQSNSVGANGYLLGLTHDEEPSHIVLMKGPPTSGLAEAAAGVLAKSVATYSAGTWLHLRLDVIVQSYGDVMLQVFMNDLTAHAVTSPTWEAIPGMSEVVDDALGVNTGSLPYSGGGYCGPVYYTQTIGRYGYCDHLQVGRQTV